MIKIGKNKIILERDMSDTTEVAINDLPMYLGEPLEIEEGVTFKRIFDICIMNRHIFNIVFHSFTRGHNIDLFIEDYLKEIEESEFVSEIEYYEVYRVFEHHIYDDKTEDNEYYYGIHGVGKPDENGNTISYGLSFTPLCKMKNKPIKTNNELDITIDTGLSFDSKDFKFEDKYKTLHKAQIPMTLFNFIGAMLFEITFYGAPDDRDKVGDDLTETARQIDAGEVELLKMEKDENGKIYFESEDGTKDYLNKDDDA